MCAGVSPLRGTGSDPTCACPSLVPGTAMAVLLLLPPWRVGVVGALPTLSSFNSPDG